MNHAKKRGLLILMILCLVVSLFPMQALAASASVSASPSSVKPGATVSVKVTFKGTNIGAVQGKFSYDSSVLQYVSGSGTHSNGNIVLYAGGSGQSSLSTTITFKALKAGSATISVSASEILDWDYNSLGTAKGSAKVTVQAARTPKPSPTKTNKPATSTPKATKTSKPATSSDKASASPKASPTATVTASPSPTPVPVTVKVGDKELQVANTLEGVTLPENFVAGQAAYNGAAVPAALDEQRGISLLYLLDEQNAGSFYVLNAAGDGVYPYVQMTSGGTYTILQKEDSVSAPEGYAETTLSIGEQTVAAWQLEGQTAPDFYLVYAMNASGTKGWYTYDAADGTMQRYVERTAVIEKEEPAEETAGPEQVAPEVPKENPGFFAALTGNTGVLITVIVLVVLCIGLAVTLFILWKKGKKPPFTDNGPQE